MIEINTKTIFNELINLSDSLEAYNNLTNSIYFEFQSIFSNWQNSKGEYLKQTVLENKSKDKQLMDGIYHFITAIRIANESYRELGDHVLVEEDSKDYINDKYGLALEAYQEIITIYDSIQNLSLYPDAENIVIEKETLQSQMDQMREYMGKTSTSLEKMEKIEDEFKGRLDGFDLIYIPEEVVVEGNATKDSDQYFFKNDEIEPRAKVISLLLVNRGKLLQKIQISLDTIIANYQSRNQKKMMEMKSTIIASLNNSRNNLRVFNDYIKEECDNADSLVRRNINRLEGLVREQ